MLDVDIEKILPVTEVRDSLNSIIDKVEGGDDLYVVTKNGKPSAIIVGVHHLEKLTGIDHKELMADADSAPVKTDDGAADTDKILSAVDSGTGIAPATTSSGPIVPLSGDLDAANPDTSTPIMPIPTPGDTGASTSAISNNGAQASPLNLSTQSTPTTVTTPSTPAASTAPAAISSGNAATGAVNDAVDDADDIFGPADEPVTPTGSPVAPLPAPSSTPASSSTIAGPLPSANPPQPSTPPPTGATSGPAQNPPATPTNP